MKNTDYEKNSFVLFIKYSSFCVGLCQGSYRSSSCHCWRKSILYSEIQGQKLQLLQQGVELEEDIDCYLLDEFMTQQLLIHQAEIDSIEVTEDMVKSRIRSKNSIFFCSSWGD